MIAAEVKMTWATLGLPGEPAIWDWCEKCLGPMAESKDLVSDKFPWLTDVNYGYSTYCFARGSDATAFILRWA